MATQTLTLKLPFLDLNGVKAEELSCLAAENVALANRILALPREERRKLTTAAFPDSTLGSAWVNQTIRTANAATKVRHFTRLPLETNNQNWTVHKVGITYSIGIGLRRGVKKRVPGDKGVHEAGHTVILDALIAGDARRGAIKLWRARSGTWSVLLSVTIGVPDEAPAARFVGIDRGQRHLAVGATPEGRAQIWSQQRIRQIRRHHARLRRKLQAAGKHKTVRRLGARESRMVKHVNHCVAKAIVRFAAAHGCGIRLEDLGGIRKAPQRQTTKRDPALNRDTWPYHDLETKVRYKAAQVGVAVETVPAAYTSQTCTRCGAIGKRDKETFSCTRCGYRGHADHNAARNIGSYNGAMCHLPFAIADGGPHGPAPNRVRRPVSGQPLMGAQEPESHTL